MKKRMTENQAAVAFWARQDKAQEARDAQRERDIINAAFDCTSHVAKWELFEGPARLLGRERALALVSEATNG